MKLTEISGNINEWFSGEGPLADVVISSRVRLARNLAGHRFLAACPATEKAEILRKLKDILMALDLGDEVFYIGVDKVPALEKRFLVERHLISQNHAFGKGPRGAVIARREFFTAMVSSLADKGNIRLSFLELDGLRASATLCFDYDKDIYLYNSAYDPAYSPLSVSTVQESPLKPESLQASKSKLNGATPFQPDQRFTWLAKLSLMRPSAACKRRTS